MGPFSADNMFGMGGEFLHQLDAFRVIFFFNFGVIDKIPVFCGMFEELEASRV